MSIAQSTRGSTGFHSGQAAEDIVAHDYTRRGCAVAARRWRGQSGEIDLILRDGEAVIFVEVKKSRSFTQASHRLSRAQMDRICGAAAEFLAGEPHGQLSETRFDLALVDGTGAVNVIKNAFMEV